MSGIALLVTTEQMKQAQRLMSSASLELVRLVHVRAANMTIAGCPVKNIEERPMPTATASLINGTNCFSVVFGHAIQGHRGTEGTTEVQVDASFELIYSLSQELNPAPTQEELQAFADTNAVMNCWPYWRELVQNMVAKMNLPPLVVPLIRWVVQPPPQPPKPAEPKKEEGKKKATV